MTFYLQLVEYFLFYGLNDSLFNTIFVGSWIETSGYLSVA